MSKILRPNQIAEILNISKPVICQLMKSGALPKIQLSARNVGVYESDVMAYLANARVNPPVNVE
jgi:excisionase family DNA binding protein